MQRSTSPLLSLFTETSELEGYGDAGSSNQGPSTYPEPEERCYCGSLLASDMRCYFCYPCGHVFCDRCWGRSPPHVRKRVQGGIPHEKTDPRLAKIIEQTLEVELDEKQQSWMHLKDENSSWFGTTRDDDDDMVFHDHGRFADLMAEMSARKRQVRYPGLVSFVGQTGAGKSTVVKLLIEVRESFRHVSALTILPPSCNPYHIQRRECRLLDPQQTRSCPLPVMFISIQTRSLGLPKRPSCMQIVRDLMVARESPWGSRSERWEDESQTPQFPTTLRSRRAIIQQLATSYGLPPRRPRAESILSGICTRDCSTLSRTPSSL